MRIERPIPQTHKPTAASRLLFPPGLFLSQERMSTAGHPVGGNSGGPSLSPGNTDLLAAACRQQGVQPRKARLMELLKGGGTGTLKGLFLTACHCETFQLRRTKTTAREPSLLWLHPGSASEMTWRVGRPGRFCHPFVCRDLSLWSEEGEVFTQSQQEAGDLK